MSFSGENFIGYSRSAKGNNSFQAFSATKNVSLPENFIYATPEEFERTLLLAQQAFMAYSQYAAHQRAEFLEAIADEIMALGDRLLERCVLESALPMARITGERNRTCGQLRLFANLLREGWWVDARIDTAEPERLPAAKPDIRRMLIPFGPVAVFGASNFPLAFSTAGGDTASALAAGCPVIVKAHPAHPGTNELVASAIVKAAQKTGMPEGVFSSLLLSDADAVNLVAHPAIKAVGFTGSRKVGMLLFNAAAKRPEPIPVFAEMSAINPVILLEEAIRVKREEIATGLAHSVSMGVGQFCTNPGLILMVESRAAEEFLNSFGQALSLALPGPMLSKTICHAFAESIAAVENTKGVSVLARAAQQAASDKYEGQPVAFTVSATDYLLNKQLSAEVFGPSTLLVLCKEEEQLRQILHQLEGQLTVTIHATAQDEAQVKPLIAITMQKAGRLIYGGYPTGVEVCHSMQHGGPFPATTDGRATSVGTAAIYRFLRPVAFQDLPDHLLPEALKNANPLNILRLVNGKWTNDQMG